MSGPWHLLFRKKRISFLSSHSTNWIRLWCLSLLRRVSKIRDANRSRFRICSQRSWVKRSFSSRLVRSMFSWDFSRSNSSRFDSSWFCSMNIETNIVSKLLTTFSSRLWFFRMIWCWYLFRSLVLSSFVEKSSDRRVNAFDFSFAFSDR
jgi:hypothetical protein